MSKFNIQDCSRIFLDEDLSASNVDLKGVQQVYQKLCDHFESASATLVRKTHKSDKVLISRVGLGFDSHAYSSDSSRECHLGCTHFAGERGIAGHSDADVVVHAVCDSLLSACHLGDLGSVFGVDKPEMKNITGRQMLEHVRQLMETSGWILENVSVQFVGNTPRIGGKRELLSLRMSLILGGVVSFGATTTDGLGFTGRSEGVVALATANVCKIMD